MTPVPADFFGDGAEAIKQYVDILLDRGLSWGLLGPREGQRIWERHILNSVAAAPLMPLGSRAVDVGSGAGLPGIPLAILRPDLNVTLLESLERRTRFLEMAVAELSLGDRVRVVRGRAEEHGDRYDVVTSRAVAPAGKLLSWSVPLLAPNGRVIALKGSSVREELGAAASIMRKLRLGAEVHDLEIPFVGGPGWALEAWVL
jgi:16S rRNA (guanine527-N7)-methyltransferase